MNKYPLAKSYRLCEVKLKLSRNDNHPAVRIRNPGDLYRIVSPLLVDEVRETLICVAFNGEGIAAIEVVSQGSSSFALALAREVFKTILLSNSTDFILVHNHPSGNIEPSYEDRGVVKAMRKAGELMCANLLDFMIVSPRGYYSILEKEPDLIKTKHDSEDYGG